MQGFFSLILQPKLQHLINMITADQLKDLCKRIDALRRYL